MTLEPFCYAAPVPTAALLPCLLTKLVPAWRYTHEVHRETLSDWLLSSEGRVPLAVHGRWMRRGQCRRFVTFSFAFLCCL